MYTHIHTHTQCYYTHGYTFYILMYITTTYIMNYKHTYFKYVVRATGYTKKLKVIYFYN